MRSEFMSRMGPTVGSLGMGALAIATLWGCGGADAGGAAADMTPPQPDLILADLKDSTYPPGPYAEAGNVGPGSLLPDFTFQGYFSPTATTGKASSLPFQEVTLGMLHDTGSKYAIVNLSAFW